MANLRDKQRQERVLAEMKADIAAEKRELRRAIEEAEQAARDQQEYKTRQGNSLKEIAEAMVKAHNESCDHAIDREQQHIVFLKGKLAEISETNDEDFEQMPLSSSPLVALTKSGDALTGTDVVSKRTVPRSI